jgi:hypothetical protein
LKELLAHSGLAGVAFDAAFLFRIDPREKRTMQDAQVVEGVEIRNPFVVSQPET